jgi:hypothetical protein
MKIHLINLPNKINFKKIKPYNTHTIIQKNILSDEGIFILSNDNLKKLVFIDESYSTITINNYELLCDNSKTIYKKIIKLPFQYNQEDVVINKYCLRKNSPLTLHIETINDTIKDVYFTTNETDLTNFSIKEDIIFFLDTF